MKIFFKKETGREQSKMSERLIEEIGLFQEHRAIGVEVWWCRFNSLHLNQNLGCSLNIDIPDDIRRSVPKRQAEYMAGRILARQALASIGSNSTEVTRNVDRSPGFPKGISGSISHTRDQALCAVTSNNAINFLGVDIEYLLCHKTANDLSNHIMNTRELKFFDECKLSFRQFATLVFSAKESVYKAIYPYIKDVIGFETSEVIGISEKHIELVLDERIGKLLPQYSTLNCQFNMTEDHIITLVAQ
ncbi:4'-phosphopantetheinyl transferase [Grimontia sp. AD028]|uniref:4'-phosphopantetheinyl transferase family protein n=1 Tax=Grimontia sp. AD028 TaxID=1581149 RepID=UPI0012E09D76|nr:4'-phosphopantetheinyl transferase superfamily protein [Grimontia sp. AD028]